ncbi:MAG: hypothetical protein Q9164_001977 [Protoblastenia rupestris]
MSPFICCGIRRAPSPEGTPIRLVRSSRRRFTISSNTSDAPSINLEDSKPIREIFASTSPQQLRSSADSDCHIGYNHDFKVRRKESIKRLQEVARGIRKRISRDSGTSGKASTRALRSVKSTEDTGKRKERKRALRDHFEREILDDRSEIYDEDALPIKTPRGTWPRQEGSIQMSPSHLKRVMARSSSPLPPANKESDPKSLAMTQPDTVTARALSRMLTARGSRITDASVDSGDTKSSDVALEPPKLNEKRSSRKYIFRDNVSSPDKIRSRSPLERPDTIIRIVSNATPVDVVSPKFLNTQKTPAAPSLDPLRLASISDATGGEDWRLSYMDSCNVSDVPSFDVEEKASKAQQPDSPINQLPPSKASWLRGASRSLAAPPMASPESGLHTHCDLENEEENFGGLDGKDSMPHLRTHSDGSNPGSVHLYNMRISQRLGSNSTVPTASLPHLKNESSSDKSWGFGPESLSLAPRRRGSSSYFTSEMVPPTWGAPRKYATSSVYTSSRNGSIASKATSSQRQVSRPTLRRHSSVEDSLIHNVSNLSGEEGKEVPISVSQNRSPHIDLDRMEALPLSTSPITRSKSLSTRDIEATKGELFSRRASTVAQGRFFSQADLDDLTQEIGRRSPPRKLSVSGFDGSGEASLSRRRTLKPPSPPRKPSVVAGDEPRGTSSWEKALRDHAEEDTKLSRRKPGSVSTEDSKSYYGKKSARGTQKSSLCYVYSSSEGQDEDLQAHLGVYRLPVRQDTRTQRQLAPDHNRISSSEATSSWSRFPEYNRAERSASPATEKDNVFARDFATIASTKSGRVPKKHHIRDVKKAHSAHFTRLKHSLRDIYRARSMDFASKFAVESRGHRSSISVGGLAEYPELEMLPSLSLPWVSEDINPEFDLSPFQEQIQETKRPEEKHDPQSPSLQSPVSQACSARKWSRLYEDCVVRDISGDSHGEGVMRHPYAHAMSEHFAPMDMEPVRVFSHSCDDVRASTLEFKRGMEESERIERGRVMGLDKGVGTRSLGG